MKIYLDHAATTQTDKDVLADMMPYFSEVFGNPSSMHSFGQASRSALTRAREEVAGLINADHNEIFFNSGGTEGDNHAIIGGAYAYADKGKHIITTKVEHHAVLDSVKFLERAGYDVTYLDVDKYGMISAKDVENAIREDTVLISVMMANNEVGTIMPIAEIGEIAQSRKILFHTDAVQAAGHIPIDVKELNADVLTMSAHKFYGPKGVGAVYLRRGKKLAKYSHGGAQERNRRAGTENIAGIVGFAGALKKACGEMISETQRLTRLRDHFISRMLNEFDNVTLNGHPEIRLPNNINLCFSGVEGEALLINLDLIGIAASSGSACMSGTFEPSHVLLAMGIDERLAASSLRLTLGRSNTLEEMDHVVDAIRQTLERLKMISPY